MKIETYETYEKNGRIFSSRSILKERQIWYIKLKNASTLSEHRILQITNTTVLLCDLSSTFGSESRYKISDVEFVELVK